MSDDVLGRGVSTLAKDPISEYLGAYSIRESKRCLIVKREYWLIISTLLYISLAIIPLGTSESTLFPGTFIDRHRIAHRILNYNRSHRVVRALFSFAKNL